MELTVKYSSKDYVFLCFRHAVQEAMRGENIDVEIIDMNYLDRMTSGCSLCDMAEQEQDNRLEEWYKNYLDSKFENKKQND